MTCAFASLDSMSRMRASIRPLALARGLVLGVLGEVAVAARPASARSRRPLYGLQPLQLAAQELGSSLGHRSLHETAGLRRLTQPRMQLLQPVGLELARCFMPPAHAALAPATVV